MGDYKRRNINLDKLSSYVRRTGICTEEAALHLMDEIFFLRAEKTDLQAKADKLEELTTTDLSIKELHITPGRLDLSATHPLAEAVTSSLVSVFKSVGAENYFEMEAYREDVGPIVITIQRREGKTPGRIAQELREELKRLKESI